MKFLRIPWEDWLVPVAHVSGAWRNGELVVIEYHGGESMRHTFGKLADAIAAFDSLSIQLTQ